MVVKAKVRKMKNTVFIIGGLALLGFALMRKKGQTTGSNASPTLPAQTAPQAGASVVNASGLTQEQIANATQATFIENFQGFSTPLFTNTSNVPWAVTGGQPGGGGLLPF